MKSAIVAPQPQKMIPPWHDKHGGSHDSPHDRRSPRNRSHHHTDRNAGRCASIPRRDQDLCPALPDVKLASADRSTDDFRRLLFRAGTGGLADYWHDISYGNFNNGGYGHSRVVPPDANHGAVHRRSARWDKRQRVSRCGAYCGERCAFTPPANCDPLHRDVACGRSVRLDRRGFLPIDTDVGSGRRTRAGTESGSIIPFQRPNYRNADWAQIGEYDDPWDAMSWANSFGSATPFGEHRRD